MACSYPTSHGLLLSQTEEEESHQKTYQHFKHLVSTLQSFEAGSHRHIHRHHDGWYASLPAMVGAMVARQYFKARPTDVLLVTFPKSGTTWLKALVFATVNRSSLSMSQHPFTRINPHDCVPFLESQVYINDQIPDLDPLPAPRLFATHIPFQSLPASVLADPGCRIIYLARNPKDNLISLWHFVNKLRAKANEEPLSLDVAMDQFCRGISMFGPYWDHVLGYWKGHMERPRNVLFLKYEELTADNLAHLKRLAEFVGCPFTVEEERNGAAEGIVRLCGFENLSSLEVNMTGATELVHGSVENSAFFRRGVVGDWENHLTPEMVRRLEEITQSKFGGAGLSF